MNQPFYLHRYYKPGLDPFRSTSELDDDEIADFMTQHFPEHSWFHEDPENRIARRRRIESWLHSEFCAKGGAPRTEHPCYFTLNDSPFLKANRYYPEVPCEVKLPLSAFSATKVSFTYPDSFFSDWLYRHPDHALYQPTLNGKVFTLTAMLELLELGAIPENTGMDTPSGPFEFYIEAQVWDYDLLEALRC